MRILATIIHKGELIIPRGDTVLRPADEVLAVVHAAHLNQLATLLGRTVRTLYDALAMHFVEAVLRAKLNRLIRFRALLHPHVLDVRRIGFAHHHLGFPGWHDDHDTVHLFRQRAKAAVAPVAFDGFDVTSLCCPTKCSTSARVD